MDPRLEQLLGHAKAARKARKDEEQAHREGDLGQFTDDVRAKGRRATDKLSQHVDSAIDHAKDFTHRRT
jgi:hypothetical protein